jgi:hypothetical protein
VGHDHAATAGSPQIPAMAAPTILVPGVSRLLPPGEA